MMKFLSGFGGGVLVGFGASVAIRKYLPTLAAKIWLA